MLLMYLILRDNVKYMVESVKRFIMSSGERYAVLVDSNHLPMTYPNLYSVIHLRNSGQSVNTIVAILEDIKLLYLLSNKLEIDIEKRIKEKNFLQLNEIELFSNLARYNRNYLFKQKSKQKILSFPTSSRTEVVRSKFILTDDSVSQDLIYRRLTNFAEYLKWFESYCHPNILTKTNKAFKSRRPKKFSDVSNDYKSFTKKEVSSILDAVNPENNQCIWSSDFLNYRNELIVYIFFYLGCRKGELLNIKLSDIDPKRNKADKERIVTRFIDGLEEKTGVSYINILRNPDDKDDSRLYQPLVKTRSRTMAINFVLRKKLTDYVLKYRSSILNAELSDFLILSDMGQALSINALDKVLSQISDKVSFNVHAHAFRHTWNDIYTEKSVNLIKAGKTTLEKAEQNRAYLMGWVPGSNSARRYSKRAENQIAIELGLEIQNKFEENNE